MLTWERSMTVTSWPTERRDETADRQVDACKASVVRFCAGLAKGVLATVLYGSGSLVLSGVLFYFSWKLGIAALLVLGGLLPLAGSGYLLWRLTRRGGPPWLGGRRWRQGGVPPLGQRPGGG